MMYVFLLLSLVLALGATTLFFYGAWTLIRHPSLARKRLQAIARAMHLTRDERNPVLTPDEEWETGGVFNPAAVDVDGTTHLFYRAVGKDGVSRIGYAVSKEDGTFSRLPYPVFALLGESPDAARARAKSMSEYHSLVKSGGSWAGTEDPRAIALDGDLYLTFSAFGGWDSMRVGVTSLPLEDLRAHRWKWTPPVYLSPKGQVHKNWVIFPEKINGKFAVLHSLHSGSRDRVLIDYLDTLDERSAGSIVSPYQPERNEASWDTTMRGAGPPPIKTPEGWLVLYHAINHREPSHYKVGAMLLDLNDPSRVRARGSAPVLSPDAHYEAQGIKPGIVYACGTTLRGDELTVYYGAADSVVCVARHSLSALLSHLLHPRVEREYPSVPLLRIPVFA